MNCCRDDLLKHRDTPLLVDKTSEGVRYSVGGKLNNWSFTDYFSVIRRRIKDGLERI